ncbi:MAG TPA: DegT/DnrJ/EryC1/StrS family aminotransferase [Candidatus Omnitrophota bacterium]|nr:DegT/DnrJ/EryC1/StrS family aminotransferase [Candidatus Omnitrophota bacterium]HQO38594.1 DegT/DnrJ/EryC1/StrS family aminotransferase [Candidatus Omnitrophota bacterium]HQQ06572.1 DegT/DnrJ/EryC1/StrS family aminotransferase [Candidatus Omnitrophota bacterium]
MIPRRTIHCVDGEISFIREAVLADRRRFRGSMGAFEERFASFIGIVNAVTVPSGRTGMEYILKALDLKRGSEVVIPAYTLKDLVPIIESLGLVAVLADVDPESFNVTAESVDACLTDRTSAVIAADLFGVPCRIDEIMRAARRRGVPVIEDCAHSAGSRYRGRMAGSLADAAFFSFETIKPVNAYGGGAVVTGSGALARSIRAMVSSTANAGDIPLKKIMSAYMEKVFLPTPLSYPFLRMLASDTLHKQFYRLYRTAQAAGSRGGCFTDFQAFLAMRKLESLPARILKREENAVLLKSLLDEDIRPQKVEQEMAPNYYFFVVLVPDRAVEARRYLLDHGVDAGIKSEIADDCTLTLGGSCPNTSRIYNRALHIPVHESMCRRDIEKIAALLNRFYQ